MLFNSVQFLIFFPVVVLGYFIIPERTKNLWLLFSSYFFYMCWNPSYGTLLLLATLTTYLGAILIEKRSNKKVILTTALMIIFGALFYFKYTNFSIQQINKILILLQSQLQIRQFDIALPIGISFFTFQAAGYLIDVFRKETKAEYNFFRYALFVSFFPQLVAGPIERSKNLLNQLQYTYRFDEHRVAHGLLIMLWGLFLKMTIADRCALIADQVFNNYKSYDGIELVIGAIAFSFQIYCDFMGYSTIARGAAKVIGIDLIDNFKQPYFSTSIKEFWRRWHISLSYWLRDYLYIPLGGSRYGKFITYRNLLATFFVSGLWLGANWHFIAWGGVHGLFIIISDICQPFNKFCLKLFRINTASISYQIFTRLYTFAIVAVAWVFFRAQSTSAAFEIIKRSFRLENFGIIFNGGIYQLGIDQRNFILLMISLILLFSFSILRELKVNISKLIDDQPKIFMLIFVWILVFLVVLSTNLSGKEFIYFQF